MTDARRKFVNWKNTAINLKLLRNDNLNLRRYVCRALNYEKAECAGDCERCKFDMDNSISQTELAKAMGVSASMVANWENGKSKPSVEDLLFYADICGMDINDVLVFENKR